MSAHTPDHVAALAGRLTRAQREVVANTRAGCTYLYMSVNGAVRVNLFRAGVLESAKDWNGVEPMFRLNPLGLALKAHMEARDVG